MDHGAVATVVIMMAFSWLCGGAPTEPPTVNQVSSNRERAEDYLSQFYFNAQPPSFNSSTRQATMHSFEETLESMQRFFGLEVTGRPDARTLEVMSQPRCGVPDVADYQHFPGRPRWSQRVVTYRITLYTNQLSRREVDATIAHAFKLYSDVIPLDFKQISSGTADIMLLFKARHHGDFYPFDGPGGVLAHANAPGPGEGGDTHFDDDEKWVLGQRGINLLLVAAHELGHALGLGHSEDRSALMFPTYHYVDTRGYVLPADDRRGVQALYGTRTARPDPRPKPKPEPRPKPKPEPPRPKPKPEPRPKPKPEPPRPKPKPDPKPKPEPRPPTRCDRDLEFDAATAIRNELYFFKNGHYWKKNGNGLTMKRISLTWPQISRVSAAYEHKGKDTVFFFHGRQYWGTRGTTVLRGFPKPLSTLGFPSYVSDIDAAVHVPSTGKTLFFSKNLFWSFDEGSFRMDRGYPRSVYKDFPGIGYRVDAAFQNHGYLYFSNGARQSEYHYQSRRVNRVLLNYAWLDCY